MTRADRRTPGEVGTDSQALKDNEIADTPIVSEHGTSCLDKQRQVMASLPSQQRVECSVCHAHSYIPMKAAMEGYFVACGDCNRIIDPVDRAARPGQAARGAHD